MKILVVEDEVKTGEYLRQGLREAGFNADLVHNGVDGLHLAQEGDYDLVILDVMLPGMDGWQVLRTLKGDERTRNVPVVMLSARAERRDKMIGLQEGAEGYIAKPFSPAEVVREVQSFLERGS